MEYIYRDGVIVSRSRNLRGIRQYAGKHLIKELHINPKMDGRLNPNHNRGRLYLIFENGATFQTDFASYGVLKTFIRLWRNVYGATLWMNGRDVGKIAWDNCNLFVKE